MGGRLNATLAGDRGPCQGGRNGLTRKACYPLPRANYGGLLPARMERVKPGPVACDW